MTELATHEKKHITLEIEDQRFRFARKTEQIAAEAQLDGIYILRTSLSDDACGSQDVVRSYKQLSRVERAFRTLKGVDLEIQPIGHYLEKRVRAHIFLSDAGLLRRMASARSLGAIVVQRRATARGGRPREQGTAV